VSGASSKGGAPVVDLVAVRRGLEALPGARALLRSVRPSRVEAFARWAEGEPERRRALPAVLSALSSVLLSWPEWRGLDDAGRLALASRAVDFLDAYRSLRASPVLDLADVGAVLASVLSTWPTWQGLDEGARLDLAEELNAASICSAANESPTGYDEASRVAVRPKGANMGRGPARMTKQRTIRLPDALWARLDAWMKAEEARRPGLILTHSETLRVLLLSALEADDRRQARRPKASTKDETKDEGGEP